MAVMMYSLCIQLYLLFVHLQNDSEKALKDSKTCAMAQFYQCNVFHPQKLPQPSVNDQRTQRAARRKPKTARRWLRPR